MEGSSELEAGEMRRDLLKVVGISVAVVVVMLKVVIGVVEALWWRPRRIEQHFSKQGIRGPSYRFFIGNVKELVAMMMKASSQPLPHFSHNILPRVLSFYHHWNKVYGSTFLVWFGPTVRLTVSDPDLIREIFTSKSQFFEKNESHPLVKQLEGDGLLSLKGEKWAHHRRIISPTFHSENLKLMVPVVTTSVIKMLEKLELAMASSKSGEVEVEASEWFQGLTEDIITRAAFGISYEEGKAIFRLQSKQMVLAAEAFQKVSIPGYRFLPTKGNIYSWKLDRQIKKSLMNLIDSWKRKWGDEGAPAPLEEECPKDLLSLLIGASVRSADISVKDIVEECKAFFFAGKHSTSNLLTWTAVLLAMHPRWQEAAREEVLRVCGASDSPTKDDVVKLKTLSMIVSEALRLYPPVIAMIRRARIDVELGGYEIPRGTEMLIPILALHHDQAIWGSDANEFNPARFADGVSRASKHPFALIPFGLGVRNCIGQNLAILQDKLALAIILQRFRFRLSPTYLHAPTVLMLLYPQHGAPIIFSRLTNHQEEEKEEAATAAAQ
ncbi:hypothetical protein SAY86_030339 [Trapa natans]|uniref:Cytochrome P450 734A1 n=1 Tax=Trapa natans TaxID=22666 RepID=A0AAN7LXS4_TRANT|nr:hypothetical protein SAY86_030339 [Trapa natans]